MKWVYTKQLKINTVEEWPPYLKLSFPFLAKLAVGMSSFLSGTMLSACSKVRLSLLGVLRYRHAVTEGYTACIGTTDVVLPMRRCTNLSTEIETYNT